MKFLASLVLPLTICVLVGCGGGSSGPRLPTIPAKGKLTIDGKPFGPCSLLLAATSADPDPKMAGAQHSVTALVKPDGTFVLTTYREGDGAPVGTYEVKVTSDLTDPKSAMNPVPACKPLTVEIAKSADGKPVEIELNLESSGGAATMGTGTVGLGGSAGP